MIFVVGAKSCQCNFTKFGMSGDFEMLLNLVPLPLDYPVRVFNLETNVEKLTGGFFSRIRKSLVCSISGGLFWGKSVSVLSGDNFHFISCHLMGLLHSLTCGEKYWKQFDCFLFFIEIYVFNVKSCVRQIEVFLNCSGMEEPGRHCIIWPLNFVQLNTSPYIPPMLSDQCMFCDVLARGVRLKSIVLNLALCSHK